MDSASLIMVKLFLKSVAACSGGPTREVKYDTTEGLDVAAHDAGIDQTGKDHAGKDQTGADIVGMPDDGYSFDGKEDGIAHADDGYVPETPAAEILGDVADADIGLDGVCTTDAACGDAQDANADTDADTPLSLPEVILPPPTDTSHDAKPAPDVIKPPPDSDTNQPLPDAHPDGIVDGGDDAIICSPATEKCNGVDDDCDNIIDNNIPEVGDDCEIGKGICHSTGVYFCDQAKLEIECDAKEIKSKIETCNGLDDSCNGLTDEGFDDTDFDGAANCVDTDDDGDGVIDENDNCPLAYNPLQEDTDENGVGNVCEGDDSDGDWISDDLDNCKSVPNTDQLDNDLDGIGNVCDIETCDEFDNNGDGVLNEGFDVGTTCFVGIGACEAKGEKICDGPSSTKCNAAPNQPAADDATCNGIDDNCNGQPDEDFIEQPGLSCGVGECMNEGIIKCVGGEPKDICVEKPVADEICDGKDNNCDGATDEIKFLDSDVLSLNCYADASKSEQLSMADCWNMLTNPNLTAGDKAYISVDGTNINGIKVCLDSSWEGKPGDPACSPDTKLPIGCASEIEFEISFFGKTQYIWKLYEGAAVLASLHFDQTKEPDVASIQVFFTEPKCNVLYNTVSCK